jgi:hypothetical protein
MSAERVGKWLTIGTNVGVFIGIVLLLTELAQNATVMKAQISNERAAQAIDILMAAAASPELSGIEALLEESGFPDNTAGITELTPEQRRQYYWYLSAQRVGIENTLYQQTLEIVYDPDSLPLAKELLIQLQAFDPDGRRGRLEQLVLEVQKISDSRTEGMD